MQEVKTQKSVVAAGKVCYCVCPCTCFTILQNFGVSIGIEWGMALNINVRWPSN